MIMEMRQGSRVWVFVVCRKSAFCHLFICSLLIIIIIIIIIIFDQCIEGRQRVMLELRQGSSFVCGDRVS